MYIFVVSLHNIRKKTTGETRMKITDIKIRRLYDHEKMKAVCSVTFDGELVFHDIKIIDNDGKTFVAMPSRRSREGVFSDIVHPINTELRNYLEDEVLTEYRSLLSVT